MGLRPGVGACNFYARIAMLFLRSKGQGGSGSSLGFRSLG